MKDLILLCQSDPTWNFQLRTHTGHHKGLELRVTHNGGALTEEIEPGDVLRLEAAAEHLVRRFRAIESRPAYRPIA